MKKALELKQKVLQAARESTISAKSLAVIGYLLERMHNSLRTCFPAIKTIAKQVHISISSVKRALKELVEHGFIKKDPRFDERKNGAQTSNLYTISTDEERQTQAERQRGVVTQTSTQKIIHCAKQSEKNRPRCLPLIRDFFTKGIWRLVLKPLKNSVLNRGVGQN